MEVARRALEPEGANPGLSPDSLVTVRVQCLDGDMASTVEATIRAGDCLCQYQDPNCAPCETDIQFRSPLPIKETPVGF